MLRRNFAKITYGSLIGAGVLLTALGSVSCSEKGKTDTSGKKRVVTSFTIIADMAREVAGDAAIVESITKPGAEIHGYDPRLGMKVFTAAALDGVLAKRGITKK